MSARSLMRIAYRVTKEHPVATVMGVFGIYACTSAVMEAMGLAGPPYNTAPYVIGDTLLGLGCLLTSLCLYSGSRLFWIPLLAVCLLLIVVVLHFL
jgi:hypothetical protein